MEGATDQVYYEEGGLNGFYYVLMTDTEGNQYRSCEIGRFLETAAEVEPMRIAPVPAISGETLSIQTVAEGTISLFDLMGRLVAKTNTTGDCTHLQAPDDPGLYIVTFNADNRKPDSTKLIVK